MQFLQTSWWRRQTEVMNSLKSPFNILLYVCALQSWWELYAVLLRAKECFIIKEHDPSLCDQNEKHTPLDVIKCYCDCSNGLFRKSWDVVPWHNLILKCYMIINCIHWHSRNIPQSYASLIWYFFFLLMFKIQTRHRESPITVKCFVSHSFSVVLLFHSCFMLDWVKLL